jgi:putative Ca2+/H+ antiporter (TMEM165/GDT1 family)
MTTLLLAFGVIFVAELGDKSQLMALAFAARYRALPILVGITLATAVVHAVSVLLGAVLAVSLPTDVITFIAGVAFLGFAAWTLRGDTLDADESAKVDRPARSAIVAASLAFFLAELGDKTMLATITLASTHNVFWVWLGSTAGMVAADAMAIVAGKLLGSRLPERTIRIGAGVAFVVFGVLLIADAVR